MSHPILISKYCIHTPPQRNRQKQLQSLDGHRASTGLYSIVVRHYSKKLRYLISFNFHFKLEFCYNVNALLRTAVLYHFETFLRKSALPFRNKELKSHKVVHTQENDI
ncbi:Hypothetical predicted protein [Octopus vulgaris]|uniref:Uncharacterized protein n=1 Tax=Octopus vulgaris TaxID=6645 RepID=A0AA36AH90_OCTVU|nr:Hypothetical predicted protein [Octopus vulgaris]